MTYTLTQENFASLVAYWKDSDSQLKWDSIFVLPAWLEVCWQVFQPQTQLYLAAVRQNERILGIAPLQLKDKKACFIGNVNLCDYCDFVVAPGEESIFFNVVLDDLKNKGVNYLELRHVRPESSVLNYLVDVAKNRGYEASCHEEAVSLELDLPLSWEEYFDRLTAKQRHELRRKLRRLEEMGNVSYRVVESKEVVDGLMDTFFKFFVESREDKAVFLTPERESFFRLVTGAMAEAGLMRFGILEVDVVPVAIVMCFDYRDTLYLYNSGYDRQYDFLSVGLLSKASCIKDSIQRGKRKFDFLKGNEVYKYQLGGKEVPLYSCRIALH